MTNTSIKLAYHIPTNKVIHVDTADNGKACKCECLKCKEKLIAVQGDIRKKHFRHDINPNCNGAQETALHQLGKQILVDNNKISIPKYGIINYLNPIAEKEFYSTRPDVTADYNELNIYFEIAVKHFVEKDKEAFFSTGQHKCVEIDLSDAEIASYEGIKYLVILETSNKKLFGWDQPQNSRRTGDNLLGKIAIGALLLLIVNWIFGSKRP
jgi:hypothetical protein